MNFERPLKTEFSRSVRQATYVELSSAGDGHKWLAGRGLRGGPDVTAET